MRNYTISSPAFIYDLPIIQDTLLRIKKIETETACKILFAIKSCSLSKIIQLVSEELDGGFASSSLFETRLIRDIVGNDCEIHLTTPVFLDLDSRDIMRLCSHIYFNSTNLFQKYSHMKKTYDFKCGLRINPGLSSVNDSRYNPCGFASKLGTPIDLLNKEFDLSLLDSIHFHTNCDSDDYETLWHIVLLLDEKIPNILEKISSINLGGGYLYSKNVDLDKLYKTISFLKKKYNLNVYLEPGSAISNHAGCYVTSVIDIFTSDNTNVAVIDGSVNHLPEIFEYQYKHEIFEEDKNGKYIYKIAGSTCLAGDQFGLYSFNEPLKIGDMLIFKNCGSYSLVKAHFFNGVNLPKIYIHNLDGSLSLIKCFDYNDFKERWI